MSRESRAVDCLQIRAVGRGGNTTTVTVTKPLPAVLGRRDLAELWFRACPRHCQTRHRNHACLQHCRALVKNVKAISKSMLEIRSNEPVQVTGKFPEIVTWRGPKILPKGRSPVTLSIGKDRENPWMVFSVTGVVKKDSWFKAAASGAVKRSKRRLGFNWESSDSSGDGKERLGYLAKRRRLNFADDDKPDAKPLTQAPPRPETMTTDAAMAVTVVHREQEPLPRKVTPSTRDYPTPLTQPSMSLGIATSADRDSLDGKQSSDDGDEEEEEEEPSPLLHLPRASLSHSSEESSSPQIIRPPPLVPRACSEVTLSEWRRLLQQGPPMVQTAAQIVLAMNQGRGEESPDLMLPDILQPDSTVLLKRQG